MNWLPLPSPTVSARRRVLRRRHRSQTQRRHPRRFPPVRRRTCLRHLGPPPATPILEESTSAPAGTSGRLKPPSPRGLLTSDAETVRATDSFSTKDEAPFLLLHKRLPSLIDRAVSGVVHGESLAWLPELLTFRARNEHDTLPQGKTCVSVAIA